MKPLRIVAGLCLLGNWIWAQPSYTLTFENFKETEAPLNYFNGGFGSRGTGPGPQLGITFNAAAAVVTAPIGKVLTTASGEAIIMNVPVGFRDSLAVNYVTVLNTGSIRICDALNCDGQFLAAINLPAGSNASQALAFSGIAKAAMLSGNGNQIGFKSIMLAPLLPPRITTTSLPNGYVGVFYTSPPMTASGGRPPYLWSAANLPVGFQIDENTGVISGNPTIVGTFGNIDVRLTDGTFPPQSDTKRFSLTIGPPPNPPRVTSFSPSNANEGSGAVEVTFNGTNFTPDAQVRWLTNGVETGLQTTVQGTTLIKAIIPAALLARAGTALIYVAQPTGNSAQFTFTIFARTQVTITSTPPGRTVLVDGESVVTPRTFDWLTGSQHNLDVPAAQAAGASTRYAFQRWSQGGSRTQSITAAQAATYTAVFSTQHQLMTPVSPSFGGSVVADPASGDGFYDEGTRVALRAVAASGFRFTGFNRDPAVVTMSEPQSLNAVFTMTEDTPARILANVPAAGLTLEAGRRQMISLTSPNGVAAVFTAAIRYPDGSGARWVDLPVQSGSTPAALSLGVLADAASGLAPGRYPATLVVSSPDLADLSVPLLFEVRPAAPASLQVDVRDLRFVSSGSEGRQSAAIVVRNPNAASLSFEVAYEASSGGSSWLSGAATSVNASESAPAIVQVSVDPAGLRAGVYSGRVVVKPRNLPEIVIPVSLVVTAAPLVRPTESAVYWRVDRDRRGTLSRTLEWNVSAGASWTAWTSQAWLRVTPVSSTTLQVDVDLDQLEEGVNRGSISVQADSPSPTPEVIVPVEVAVMPSGYPAVSARPQAVAFAGTSLSATRKVVFEASRSGPVTVGVSQPWLAAETRAVDSRTFEINLRVADASQLGPGTYRAVATIQDAGGAGTSVPVLVQVGSSQCTASRLIPLVTSTAPWFDLDGGAPTPLEVQLIDDCGGVAASSAVVAAVTSGREPQIQLTPTGDGRWKGSWTSSVGAGAVALQVLAADPARGIGAIGQAEPSVAAAIVSASSRPVLQREQPLETEAGARLSSLSPGMRFRIRGQNLLTPDAWPEVLLGGRSLAVLDASSTQLTVETPADLLSDALLDLIVRVGGVASIPEPVVVGSRKSN